MIKLLTCPQCSSAFRVPAEAVPDGGRQVRCSSCKHEWLALPIELRPDPAAPIEEPEEENVASPVASYEKDSDTEQQEFNSEGMEGFHPGNDFADHLMSSFDDQIHITTAQPQIGAYQGLKRGLYVANSICALIALMLGMIVFKDHIINHLPALNSVYEAIGYNSTKELQLSGLSFSRESDKGVDRYAMKGEIVNHGAKAAPTPSIRARLFTKEGEMLKEWVLSSPGILKAGESKAFNAKNLKSAYSNGYMLALEIGSPVELMLRK